MQKQMTDGNIEKNSEGNARSQQHGKRATSVDELTSRIDMTGKRIGQNGDVLVETLQIESSKKREKEKDGTERPSTPEITKGTCDLAQWQFQRTRRRKRSRRKTLNID
jgi:hypothetical protein